MRTDRELLELAAAAAGIEVTAVVADGIPHRFGGGYWNPLTDDGDALRLAIDVGIHFRLILEDAIGYVECQDVYIEFDWNMHTQSDRYESVRRAIVRAAAEIGAQGNDKQKGKL